MKRARIELRDPAVLVFDLREGSITRKQAREILDAFLLSVEMRRHTGRGRQARAARALGVSPATISEMLAAYDRDTEEPSGAPRLRVVA